MMRCLAIDDEPLALSLLVDNISKVPFLELVASCGDPFKAIEIMQRESIDLIFTDIQMPGLTGLQFIEGLISRPIVILITAYKQYALQSYDLDVVDYLVKPVGMDRFIKACNKANELFQLKKSMSRPINPDQVLSQKPSEQTPTMAAVDYLFVNVGYSLEKVTLEDIIYIEGLRSYINIHLTSQPQPLLTRATMKSIEAYLPAPAFMRIHKSYIIATRQIRRMKKNELTLLDGTELPIGEIYRPIVNDLIRNQLG
jgi:DNA-binding LytR/AlgR family response regulator